MSQKDLRSPISIALGRYFQQKRNQKGLSVEEVAKNYLDISPSSYRAIESSWAVLQPNRALQVIQLFDRINFESISKLLTTIQIMLEAKDYHQMELLAKKIASFDNQLGLLFSRFQKVWILMREEKDISKFIEEEGLPTMEVFLTDKNFGNEKNIFTSDLASDIENLKQEIGEVSCIYQERLVHTIINSMNTLIKNLKFYSFSIPEDENAAWENTMFNQFISINGIIRNYNNLKEESLIENYLFPQITNTNFLSYKYLIIAKNEEFNIIKEVINKDFKNLLKAKFSPSKKNHLDILKKIEIRVMENPPTFIKDINLSEEEVWIYRTKGIKEQNTYILYGSGEKYKGLRIKDVEEVYTSFNKLWNNSIDLDFINLIFKEEEKETKIIKNNN